MLTFPQWWKDYLVTLFVESKIDISKEKKEISLLTMVNSDTEYFPKVLIDQVSKRLKNIEYINAQLDLIKIILNDISIFEKKQGEPNDQ